MEARDFKTCLICGIVAICMLFGLVGTAFVASNAMIDNAAEQLYSTRKQAVVAYRMAVDKYNGTGNAGGNTTRPDTGIQLQNPTVPDDTEPVVTDPVGTEPVSDNTGDSETSTGDGDKSDTNDNDNVIDNTVDLTVIPNTDPKPENTGWDEDEVFVEHIVMPGDTLSQIAEMYGVGMDEVAEFNGIENIHSIRAGQVLIIPTVENWNEV